uniref:Uncharacterized protein n=1 Tax=viral metagenome TaxID=1070528 RepID=A0A6M3KVV6_9ZZZZ
MSIRKVKCTLCGKEETEQNAMEQNWTPYFYDGATERDYACPACTSEFLTMDENGEHMIKF